MLSNDSEVIKTDNDTGKAQTFYRNVSFTINNYTEEDIQKCFSEKYRILSHVAEKYGSPPEIRVVSFKGALTRLRAATIKEFDTIARLETQVLPANAVNEL